MRGPKGKPINLHLVEGTFHSTRHTKAAEVAKDIDTSPPIPPYKLNAEQLRIWNRYVKLLWWNTEVESELLILYINLTIDRHKHEKSLATKYHWTPAMIGRYVQTGAELGIGYANKKRVPSKKKDKGPESKHFT